MSNNKRKSTSEHKRKIDTLLSLAREAGLPNVGHYTPENYSSPHDRYLALRNYLVTSIRQGPNEFIISESQYLQKLKELLDPKSGNVSSHSPNTSSSGNLESLRGTLRINLQSVLHDLEATRRELDDIITLYNNSFDNDDEDLPSGAD
jgi:hypothetical protein